MNNQLARFDDYWTNAVQNLPARLSPVMKAATMFGQPGFMGVIVAICGLISLAQGDSSQVMFYSVVLVVIPIASVIKIWIHRPRPATYTRTWLPSYSFPSGHAYSSALVLCTIAFANASLPLLIFAILGTTLVGMSRVYRGAHYPSDVVGGWLLAIPTLWAVISFVGR